VTLTTEKLAELYSKELTVANLTDLPDDFFEEVGKYLTALSRELEESDGLKRELAEERLKETVFLLDMLHQVRTVKAMVLLSGGQVPSTLLAKERNGFLEIKKILENLRRCYREGIFDESAPRAPAAPSRILVVLNSDLNDKILGTDGKVYGPFKKGNIANLPAANAELLLRHGIAKKIGSSENR
jgi:DNA replication factor GINS